MSGFSSKTKKRIRARGSQINILISPLKKQKENMKYAYDYYCPSSNFRSLMVIKISSFFARRVVGSFSIQESRVKEAVNEVKASDV